MSTFLKPFIGERSFYKNIIRVGLPLALSGLLESCLSIIDSIMVSGIGMLTAVGNASQIMSMAYTIMFGISAGLAIFAAQFYGAKQKENMAKVFSLAIILYYINGIFWVLVIYLFGKQLLMFYLKDAELAVYSLKYIRIVILTMLINPLPRAVSNMFQATQNTKISFYTSVVANIFNVVLNYVFIYVLELGVEGAAYATLGSTIVMFIMMLYFGNRLKPDFFDFSQARNIDANFPKRIFERSLPIIINETLFGFGTTLMAKAYGMLGTSAMDTYYVVNQVYELFSFLIWGYGTAVSILIGGRLGSGEIEQAKKESGYQIALGFMIAVSLVTLMLSASTMVFRLYSVTTVEEMQACKSLLYVYALKLFFRMFIYVMFCTLKAGGDSKAVTFLDCGLVYIVGVPVVYASVYLLGIRSITLMVLMAQLEQLVRLILTAIRYRQFHWAKDLTTLF
ncbi:MAG: MATE family efflux transporter [Erysipelotrichaceae bacterium]|nr:MATE family efflux transporter [Erysipelotrichaceae bacterium]